MYSLKEAKNAAQDWIDELGTMDWPAYDYFVMIAETPSPSSQNSIAFAFFSRHSFWSGYE